MMRLIWKIHQFLHEFIIQLIFQFIDAKYDHTSRWLLYHVICAWVLRVMKKFLDMNVCLYKLYKCVHDRVRRFYTSAGQVTYGHGAFSSNSSTLLWETSKERDTRTQLGTKEKETGISPGVEREREIERERQAPWVSTFFNTLFAFLLALHILSENILMFILSRRKRIRRAGALFQETLVMTRFVQKTRRL